MADPEKATQPSAVPAQTGPSQAPPPPPGYTYGWVQTPPASAPQTAQPTGGMPDWAKSKKTLFIVLGVLGFFLLSNVFERPQPQQTRKPANPAVGTRLTSKEQVDATAK